MGIDEPDRPADRQPPAFIGGGGPLHLAYRPAAGPLHRRDQPPRRQQHSDPPHHHPAMIDRPLALRLVATERPRPRHPRQTGSASSTLRVYTFVYTSEAP